VSAATKSFVRKRNAAAATVGARRRSREIVSEHDESFGALNVIFTISVNLNSNRHVRR
jgi:hypothetical protein